jgi:hypothetical protein
LAPLTDKQFIVSFCVSAVALLRQLAAVMLKVDGMSRVSVILDVNARSTGNAASHSRTWLAL